MAINIQQINSFQPGSNPFEAWTIWKRDFGTYLKALKYHKEDEDVQIALFLQVCGGELKQKYQTLTFTPTAASGTLTLEDVLRTFDDHFKGYKNLTMASYVFWNIQQQPGQAFDQFLTELRLQAQECDFGTATDRNMKDRIILGITDQPLRERLLRDGTISLDQVIQHCRSAEISKVHASAMQKDVNKPSHPEVDLDVIQRKPNYSPRYKTTSRPNAFHRSKFTNKPKSSMSYNSSNGPNTSMSYNSSNGPNAQHGYFKQKPCTRCGLNHALRACPANGTICKCCKKQNHWASVCFQRKFQNNQGLNELQTEKNELPIEDEILFLGEITDREPNKHEEWYQTIEVNGNKIDFKLDTGAQVNVIPKLVLAQWQNPPFVKQTAVRVSTYTGELLPVVGECQLGCVVDHNFHLLKFLVVDLPTKPVLGAQACHILNLVRRVNHPGISQISAIPPSSDNPENILREFEDVFQGTGRLKGTYKITLKDDAIPQIAAPRRIPVALENKVKSELNRMETEGIIIKVDTPTDWVSNMVVVEKKDSIRICLDPRPLNKAIKRSHYQLPTTETIFAKLSGSKLFTVLDAKHAFWHLSLDESSSYLTTFITPFGRYRFLVMPFGLNCAPETFQRAMDDIFAEHEDLNAYYDDLVFGAEDYQKHCQQLRRALQAARMANLKLNKDKTKLALDKIPCLGHVISQQGIEPDPRKVAAVTQFPAPTNKEELQRFLGMATYLMKCIPDFSHETHILRQLLKKDAPWIWDSNVNQQFIHLKNLLTKAPILTFYDKNKPLVISADASSYGLGAVLLQDNKPIAYASVSLTETQRAYAQIEKELLAIVFAAERFHYYVYGHSVEVHTDHKPLIGLSKKPFDVITPRLQRFLLRLQRYDLSFTYIPGKQLTVADTLSRAPSSTDYVNTAEADNQLATVCLIVQATPSKLEEIRQQTKADEELQSVIHYVKQGWPEERAYVDVKARKYWHCREELHISDDLLCRGRRLVLPQAERADALAKIHLGHRGVVSCKKRAREALYWPGMNQAIEDLVLKCSTCQKYQHSNQHEPLMDREIPTRPWERLAIDFFHLNNNVYLLLIDYYSKFIELQLMRNTTGNSVINALKAIYARFGIPSEIVSDQGPPFNSKEFADFNKSWDIKHSPTSPHYPRANGLVERCVQTVKSSLRKANETGDDLYAVLMSYRTTPIGGLPSPAEMLMGRCLRTLVPVHPSLLKPIYDTNQHMKELQRRQERQHRYADRSSKLLPPLSSEDKVWFQNNNKWNRGTVTRIADTPRSFVIKADDGGEYQRNRIHLRPRTEDPKPGSNTIYKTTAEDYYDSGITFQHEELPRREQRTFQHEELPRLEQRPHSEFEQPEAVVPTHQDTPDEIPPQQVNPARTTRSGRTISKPARFTNFLK